MDEAPVTIARFSEERSDQQKLDLACEHLRAKGFATVVTDEGMVLAERREASREGNGKGPNANL